MRYRSMIVLFMLQKFRGERSVNGLYHLLNGKKSSQTIQDAKLYDVSFLFQTMRHVSPRDIYANIIELHQNNRIYQSSDDCYLLTKEGKNVLQTMQVRSLFPAGLDGWLYGDHATTVWKRLSLYIQSLSYLLYGNKGFLPVQRNQAVTDWVKARFPSRGQERFQIANEIYDELTAFLDSLPKEDATVFMKRLSGRHRTGLTFEQIASKLKEDEDKVRIVFQSVLHRLVAVMKYDPASYPVLEQFSEGLLDSNLTVTTRKTYSLIRQGKSIDEIRRLRGLKQSTIEDHFVELALHEPSFSIDTYVNRELQRRIASEIMLTNTKKLKSIKDKFGEEVSYFAIRLVMAKTGAGNNA